MLEIATGDIGIIDGFLEMIEPICSFLCNFTSDLKDLIAFNLVRFYY